MKQRLNQFRRDQDGVQSIEIALMFPLLAWGFLACYIFFDAYRERALNIRMADTIADIVSREVNPVDDSYIDGMYRLQKTLTRSKTTPTLIISSITYDLDNTQYLVEWSEARGGSIPLPTGAIGDTQISDRLPIMSDGDTIVLVQTKSDFQPFFNIGMSGFDLNEFVAARPRSGRICFDTCPASPDDPII
ncbi:TadE/TadG family type IV pilus assembly protein [Aestuariibius insulae]|uniref:TadE/TadG family type IV pilus assembly protein n=1 Tax=Aestuariibius insulae TaxID=2058287 RepID=UPI00345E5D23